ncbi:rod shape-determining protein MreC, partial [bacterium]|nr:rod shape-determining protein MreC [bacterium]
HGVLVCDNYKRFIVKYVHYDVSVKKGELVLTSGLGNIYPGGIAVGKVEKTMAGTEAFAQDISVILEVDFAKIDKVMLLKKDPVKLPATKKKK